MLTVNEAAARVGVCHSVVRGWIADGLLSHYRIGATGNRGKILIEEAALDALKATFRVGGGAVQSPVPRATPKPKLKYLRA